jgi:diadenosine tetraphosphate (Ap4A) HIT family hydrolase
MDDYERFKIADFPFWAVYLHTNQYFLGRMYTWSKRPGLVDLMDITDEEQKELFLIGHSLKIILREVFRPDLFNWASLGNLSTQCHMHLIPRYAKERIFLGTVFRDGRWGKNYAPYDYDFKVSDEILYAIRDTICHARCSRET